MTGGWLMSRDIPGTTGAPGPCIVLMGLSSAYPLASLEET